MDGIICVRKPSGYTSFDVVAIMRRLCGTKKTGHGGTLDPIAEGVLPIFIGNATKAVDFTPSDDKEYFAGFKLGLTTDTQDITGNIIIQNNTHINITLDKLKKTAEQFKGDIRQIPPMYSAVSVGGKRLYELARKGVTIERKARPVTIHELEILEYDENNSEGLMKIACSRGTYIRTLIHDIGQELDIGAVMTSLTRTKSGIFTLDLCYDLDNLRECVKEQGADYIKERLIPLDKLFEEYPKIYLESEQSRLFKNGAQLDANRLCFERVYDGVYSVYNFDMSLVAIAKVTSDDSLSVLQRFSVPRD